MISFKLFYLKTIFQKTRVHLVTNIFLLKDAICKETRMFENERPKLVDEFLVILPVLIKIAAEYGL
jgi:hypothetical protein